jgi:hypothetical protein
MRLVVVTPNVGLKSHSTKGVARLEELLKSFPGDFSIFLGFYKVKVFLRGSADNF